MPAHAAWLAYALEQWLAVRKGRNTLVARTSGESQLLEIADGTLQIVRRCRAGDAAGLPPAGPKVRLHRRDRTRPATLRKLAHHKSDSTVWIRVWIQRRKVRHHRLSIPADHAVRTMKRTSRRDLWPNENDWKACVRS
jgi:hypothetical protein